MKLFLRVLRVGAASVATLVLLAAAGVYAVAETNLRERHAPVGRRLSVPTDSASVAAGKRLARVRGCTGCHGLNGQGSVFVDAWFLARVVSPNLTLAVRTYTDEQLEGIIRQGVRPDGSSLVVMPSGMFAMLTDDDLGSILAYLRALPPRRGHEPDVTIGPMARVAFALGAFEIAAREVQRADSLTPSYPARDEPHAAGAYLARTSCSECHGLDLRGRPGDTPDLTIAAAYTLPQFRQFMRTGEALGGRELPLMSAMSRNRFTHFTDGEIDALHGYLIARR